MMRNLVIRKSGNLFDLNEAFTTQPRLVYIILSFSCKILTFRVSEFKV